MSRWTGHIKYEAISTSLTPTPTGGAFECPTTTPGFSPGQGAATPPSERGFKTVKRSADASNSVVGLKPQLVLSASLPRAEARGGCPFRRGQTASEASPNGLPRTAQPLLPPESVTPTVLASARKATPTAFAPARKANSTALASARKATPGFSPGQYAVSLPSESGFSPTRRPGKATPLLILLLLLGFSHTAVGQGVSKIGTTAAEFLKIDVGPRAVAMGGAFVAAVDDASSLYWNPAGLAHMPGSELITTHTEWMAELSFDYLGVAINLGNAGVAGVSVTMLSVPDMIVRTVDRPDGTGETYDAADLAVGLSYGRSVTDRFSIGATAKYIRQRIWHSEATAIALDVGTQFRTDFFGGLTIGAAIYNFGSDLKLDGRDLRTFVDPDPGQLGNNNRIPANYELDTFKLPLNFQFGITTVPIRSRMHKLTINADALHPNSNNESLNAGFEYGYQERVFFRGGYRGLFLNDAEGGLSGGVAVYQSLFEGGIAKLDYAFRAGGRLGDIHVVGFGLTF